MKTKYVKAKIKRIRSIEYIQMDEKDWFQSTVDFFRGKGYFVYADPTGDGFTNIILSDHTLTYRDLKRRAKRFGIDLNWWNKETIFNELLDNELPQYS